MNTKSPRFKDMLIDLMNEEPRRPVNTLTDDEAAQLAKIHRYDIPEDDGVKEELIGVYDNTKGETITLGAYLPIKYYLEGLIWLYQKGFDVGELLPDNLKSLLNSYASRERL